MTFDPEQPRDDHGRWSLGDNGQHTLEGAKSMIRALGVPGVRVIGSVARKGASMHDLDLRVPSTGALRSVKAKLLHAGFESEGMSRMSPKESAAYHGPKTFATGWSRMDHFHNPTTGHHVDVWSFSSGRRIKKL